MAARVFVLPHPLDVPQFLDFPYRLPFGPLHADTGGEGPWERCSAARAVPSPRKDGGPGLRWRLGRSGRARLSGARGCLHLTPPPPPPIRCSRHSSSTAWRRLRTHPLDADSIWAGSALARVYCPRGPHHRLPLAAAAPRAPSPRPAVPRSPARLRDFRADSPRQARHGSIPPGASFLLPGPRPFPTLNHYCSPASLLVLFLSPPQVAGLRGLPPSLPRGLGSSALRLPRAACGCPGPGAPWVRQACVGPLRLPAPAPHLSAAAAGERCLQVEPRFTLQSFHPDGNNYDV